MVIESSYSFVVGELENGIEWEEPNGQLDYGRFISYEIQGSLVHCLWIVLDFCCCMALATMRNKNECPYLLSIHIELNNFSCALHWISNENKTYINKTNSNIYHIHTMETHRILKKREKKTNQCCFVYLSYCECLYYTL